MSREYNYGGTSLIVDSIEEIFESGAVSTKTVNNIKQIIGQQRQSKDIKRLEAQIGGAAEDGTISASEKPGLKREWASLQSSYATISDRFEQDENLSDNTFLYLLKANYEALSPIMGEIFADMDTDYTNKDKVSQITDLFVNCWDYIAKCSKYIEDKMSLSDRFSLQVSSNREIVSSLAISLKLLFYIDGSYADVTYNEAYADSDFVWRKTSDENFSRTGRTLNLTLSDFSSSEETFSVTFKHVSHYEDANNTEFIVEKRMNFSVRTGTLSQWAWSDADTKEELLADPFKVWTTDRTESNGKKYLWRRDTKDVLKADSEKEWTYFRESGLDGLIGSNGYSRAVLELFKRSETTPAPFDGGVITYTFSTNAISGDTGSWQKTIPSGEHPLYIIKATAFANTETDAISTGEWTTPAILSEHGTDGATGATAFSLVLFQRSESSPSKPSDIVTYNIKTGAITGNGNWTLYFPSNNGYPCWAINATAFSYTDTDEILPNEWSDVQKLVEDGKDGESAIQPLYQWRLSASTTVPPTDTTVYMVDGSATFYNGALLVNAVDGWVDSIPTPTPDHPYIWQRISNDNGLTWGEPFCLSINTVEYLEVSCKPQFYTLNGRGVNDKEQAIDVTIDRTFIPIENPCYIKVSTYKDDAIVDNGEWREHNASSTYRIQIPMHITYDRIIVEVSCGTWNKAISIDAVIDESKKGEKQLGIVYLNQNKIYKDEMLTQEITHLNDNPAMPFIDGDYCMVYVDALVDGKTEKFPIPYRYTNGTWTALKKEDSQTMDYASIMLDTLDVAVSTKNTVPVVSAHYAFIQDFASNAVVTKALTAGSSEFVKALANNDTLKDLLGNDSALGELLSKNASLIEALVVMSLLVASGKFVCSIGLHNGSPTFDIKYGDGDEKPSVFKIDPVTGKVFIGKPNANMTAADTGFMYDPSTEELSSKDRKIVIDGDGEVYIDGYINATAGNFNGTINANAGFFKGDIETGSFSALMKIGGVSHTATTGTTAQSQIEALLNAYNALGLEAGKSYPITINELPDVVAINYVNGGNGTWSHFNLNITGNVPKYDLAWWRGTYTSDITYAFTFTLKFGEGQIFKFNNLPTSSIGLESGQVWSDNGTLKIV